MNTRPLQYCLTTATQQTVSITATDSQAYERHEGDLISYTLTRTGDDSEDLAVTIKVGGSAAEDTDYESDFANVENLRLRG